MVTDIKVFVEGLQANTTLTELDFSRNDISDKVVLTKGLAECLKVNMIFCVFLIAISLQSSSKDFTIHLEGCF